MTLVGQRMLAGGLARAFLGGPWTRDGLVSRGTRALDRRPAWLGPLATRVLRAYKRAPLDRPRELAAWIELNLPPATAGERVRNWLTYAPAMGSSAWPVPPIPTLGDLALFLRISSGDLGWFAGGRRRDAPQPRSELVHYRYRWIARAGGGARLLEAPKLRLGLLQKRLLHEVLDRVPPHDAAHGFVAGRSVRTFAQPHVGAPVVVRLDLEDFFASVTAGRVYGILRTAGYPESVAHALAGVCTNAVPAGTRRGAPEGEGDGAALRRARLDRRLELAHLPQGAPTSPALANLAAHGLDRRLTGLADTLDLRYTRYADDLAFSGAISRTLAARLAELVRAIALEEGFAVNAAKTRVMAAAQRQRLAGVVVNRHPNSDRREYDLLRAIRHNVARDGLAAQNRAGHANFEAHLRGRVAWVAGLNPNRGAALGRQLQAALAR